MPRVNIKTILLLSSVLLVLGASACGSAEPLPDIDATVEVVVTATPTAVPPTATATLTSTYVPSKPYVFEVLDKHPRIECLNENMDVFINVFGLYVISNQSFAPGHAMHTANILAEYIDNDLDGAPDDLAVLSHLQGQNYVVPVWTIDVRVQFW